VSKAIGHAKNEAMKETLQILTENRNLGYTRALLRKE